MRLGAKQELFSRDLSKLLVHAHTLGYEVRIGEVQRTTQQQQWYVDNGRSKTMRSMHLLKCAADLHFTLDGVLCYPAVLGTYWESLSPENRWGGFWKTFKDSPHFQRNA